MERPFEEEEVLVAFNSLKEDKATGQDKFPMTFYKVFWEIVEKEEGHYPVLVL